MIQTSLEIIYNDKVLSVSPQTGKITGEFDKEHS